MLQRAQRAARPIHQVSRSPVHPCRTPSWGDLCNPVEPSLHLHASLSRACRWFLEKTGHTGLNNLLAAYDDKSAYAQTIFSFSPGPGGEVHTFDGRVPGRIVPARGPTDFGWDPVFLPDGYEHTYAEMEKATKTAMSHRTVSLTKLQTWLMENADSLRNAKQPRDGQ